MGVIKGNLPVAMVPGNHDYGPGGKAKTRDSLFNDYLTKAQSTSPPTVQEMSEIAQRSDKFEEDASAAKNAISGIKTSIQQHLQYLMALIVN